MNERVATVSDRCGGATSPPPLPPTIPSLVLPVLHKLSQVIIPWPPLIGRNPRSRQMSVWCVIRRVSLLPPWENRPLPLYLANYMRHLSSSPIEEQGNTCTHTYTHNTHTHSGSIRSRRGLCSPSLTIGVYQTYNRSPHRFTKQPLAFGCQLSQRSSIDLLASCCR